ncbi:hypothetical protein DUNSADRAFT_1245 [Dunaliella salina]|uniref:Protein kinase domain-containing protein n=1 Tax=Dunaliella salina TaxID=3046 RepID=A0ABQ7FXR5_DUNSA|nr:hypothetical protein DUNSADRAFT_1245 [Dunaliella salina]|eukprot:KAF5827148.1 hypothetical protein DUNSADRAFT_1245 [Dunaliella salina]
MAEGLNPIQVGLTSIRIGSSTKRELSNTEGKATPKSEQRIGTRDVSGPQCTVILSSKTPRVSGETATTKHNGFTKAIPSLRGASEGSCPARSIDRIEKDESSMPIQKIAADQSGPLPFCGFQANVRREVERLLIAGANDDSLRLEFLLGKGATGAVYKGSWKGLTVAVKTMLFTARVDEVNRAIPNEARAVLEAAVCIFLSHPNIVSTYHYDIKKVSHHNESNEDRMSLHVERSAGMLEDWKLFLVLAMGAWQWALKMAFLAGANCQTLRK